MSVLSKNSVLDEINLSFKVGKLFLPLKKLFGYVKTSIRSGLIGTFIGALPGAGANVASFLSYDIGKKRAKPEEKKLSKENNE